jgi:predicted nucleic acid-binding protein
MAVFADTNILLELFLVRSKHEETAKTLLDRESTIFVSALSVNFLLYMVEKYKLPKEKAWEFVDGFRVSELLREDLAWAHDNDAGDYEDALQIAAARRQACTEFITLDKDLVKMYGHLIGVTTVD